MNSHGIYPILYFLARGEEKTADAHCRAALPLIVFVMQSIKASLTHGKRIAAERLGLDEEKVAAAAEAGDRWCVPVWRHAGDAIAER